MHQRGVEHPLLQLAVKRVVIAHFHAQRYLWRGLSQTGKPCHQQRVPETNLAPQRQRLTGAFRQRQLTPRRLPDVYQLTGVRTEAFAMGGELDRKSTRLNSSHVKNSYAVLC